MHTDKKTARVNLNSSMHLKNKKLIKSISEKFIEEYAIKISTRPKAVNGSVNVNKVKQSRKSSISPTVIKNTTTQTQISNISTCSDNSNNTKKQIIHRNRNKQSPLLSTNSKTANGSLKFSSYTSAFNMSNKPTSQQNLNSNSTKRINVMKKKLLHNSNINNNNSTFLEIDEELNQSSIKQKKKLNRSSSQNPVNESNNNNSSYKEYIPVFRAKNLKSSRNTNDKNFCNLSSQNILNSSSQGSVLYYKKQIRLNSSMDNALTNKIVISNNKVINDNNNHNIKVNSSMCISSKSVNNGSFLRNSNIITKQVIEDPEEIHFAFVELCQKKKKMYTTLERKFNNNYNEEDILNCA